MGIRSRLFWSVHYTIVDTCQSIYRIIQWIPIIWKDRDYDYGFWLSISAYKLRRLRNFIEKRGLHEGKNRTVKQIDYVFYLQSEIEAFCPVRFLPQHELLKQKWGELTFRGNGLFYEKTVSDEENASAHAEFWKLWEAVHDYQQKCKERLSRHLLCYHERWWD